MSDQPATPGRYPALAEAQELLLARRAELRRIREEAGANPAGGDPGNPPYPEIQQQIAYSLQPTGSREGTLAELAEAVDRLPQHLGWGCAAQTVVLRAHARRASGQSSSSGKIDLSRVALQRAPVSAAETVDETPDFTASGTISLPPSLGLAILRRKQAPAARLWLLLRYLDKDGRGVIQLQEARAAFTDSGAPLRFCGARRLRSLLAAGDDLFWTTDGERIWLRSTVRVAAALDVQRFRGQAVAIPVSTLTAGIGAVRAHLFAAFHSGRKPAPIARQTLAIISGVAPRTQRHYDRISGATKQANYACGPRLGSAAAETVAWQQGPAAFTWSDSRGQADRIRQRYLAWQLPNSYNGPHTRLGRGGRKRHNKALADLLQLGTAGNGRDLADACAPRYFAHACAAARVAGSCQDAIYWPAAKPGIWHALWNSSDQRGGGDSPSSAYPTGDEHDV